MSNDYHAQPFCPECWSNYLIYYDEGWYCPKCFCHIDKEGYIDTLDEVPYIQHMTKGDFIRMLSDEELSVFIAELETIHAQRAVQTIAEKTGIEISIINFPDVYKKDLLLYLKKRREEPTDENGID